MKFINFIDINTNKSVFSVNFDYVVDFKVALPGFNTNLLIIDMEENNKRVIRYEEDEEKNMHDKITKALNSDKNYEEIYINHVVLQRI